MMIKRIPIKDGEKVVVKSSDFSYKKLYAYVDSNELVLFDYSDYTSFLYLKNRINLDEKAFSEFLTFGLSMGNQTELKNLYIICFGEIIEIQKNGLTLKLNFYSEDLAKDFSPPLKIFKASKKNVSEKSAIEKLLQSINESVYSNLDDEKNSNFLFHSAGKDSNTIALAISKYGDPKDFTLITQSSSTRTDESELARKYAARMGFTHTTLKEKVILNENDKKLVLEYGRSNLSLCSDNVSLAYPLYLSQIPALRNSNIVDGGGNDYYMGCPPTRRDFFTVEVLAKFLGNKLSVLRKLIKSESLFNKIFRKDFEWYGLSGLSYKDSNSIFPEFSNKFNFSYKHDWKKNTNLSAKRTAFYAQNVIPKIHLQKVENFCIYTNSNLILPFLDVDVIKSFSNFEENRIFSRSRNKPILRDILNNEIGLDSDSLGKLGFSYDSVALVTNNESFIREVILSSSLWNKGNVESLLNRFFHNLRDSNYRKDDQARFILRIFVSSLWLSGACYDSY